MKRIKWLAPLLIVTGCSIDTPTATESSALSDPLPPVNASVIAEVSAVHAWLGVKNSDDVGTKFDLLVEMLRNGQVVASGQFDAVPGGSSGFNNAHLRTITSDFDAADSFDPGDVLGIRISVRIAEGVTGHRSGTARLWYGNAEADSRADIQIGNTTLTYYLTQDFTLASAPAAGTRKTIDVKVDRAVGGNPFKPFGTWTTTPPVPPRVIDVATTFSYRTPTTGVVTPMLAQWGDGAILMASWHPAGASFTVTSPSAGTVLKTPLSHVGSRPTIWIPQSGTYPEIALGNFGVNRAMTRSNQIFWDNTDFGCCGAGLHGFPLDPVAATQWRGKGRARLDLTTGIMSGFIHGFDDAPLVHSTPNYIYEARPVQGAVFRQTRVGNVDLIMPLPTAHGDPYTPGATTAAQGYINATTFAGGVVTHYTPTGQAWSIPVPGPGAPVITGSDLVVVKSETASGTTVRALRLSDGSDAWSTPVGGTVTDLIVGDGGNLYVLLGAANTILALDASSGALRKSYINVPTATEMILWNGTMYVVGPTELIAIPVESQNYDPLSPWPVRYGDNQRTNNLPAGRVR